MNWVKINKNNKPKPYDDVLIRLSRKPYKKGNDLFVVAYLNDENKWVAAWHNTEIGGKPTHFSIINY